MWLAKPNLNNNTNSKTFDKVEDAVTYLEEVTGYKMDFVRNKKTKVKTYDWQLVGKLVEVK